MAVVVETTAKVLAERRLSGERERLAQLFEQAPGFMAMLRGPEHRFELVNPSYLRLVGSRPLLGRSVAEALPEAASQGYVSLAGRRLRERAGVQRPRGAPSTCTRHPRRRPRSAMSTSCSSRSATRPAPSAASSSKARTSPAGSPPSGAAKRWCSSPTAFATSTIPGDVAFVAARLLGEALAVSRVGYGTIDPDAETLHVRSDWNAPGVESLAGVLQLRDYGSFIESLKDNEFIAIADVRDDPRTRGGPGARGAQRPSFVNVPVVEQGRLVAVLYVNHAERRDWSDDDLALVREVAERTRTAVERARGAQALRESEARPARGERIARGEGAGRVPASCWRWRRSFVRRRRWRRSASSPAASPTTSTTCSAP
jgi:hypothetical protein